MKLTLILRPYKPELSIIRSCPDRLEFKNECYSTVNQSISKKTSVFALILWEEQRLNRFWREKRCRNSTLTLGSKQSVLPSFNTYQVMWKYNCEPLWRKTSTCHGTQKPKQPITVSEKKPTSTSSPTHPPRTFY